MGGAVRGDATALNAFDLGHFLAIFISLIKCGMGVTNFFFLQGNVKSGS